MKIDKRIANKLLIQWGRWSSQPIDRSEIMKATGQIGDNPLAVKKNRGGAKEWNEPLMIFIDGILRSNRLSQRQREIAKLEWKVRQHWDQEQRKRCYNRRYPESIINLSQYRNAVRSIKEIVANEVNKHQKQILDDTIAVNKHKSKYLDEKPEILQNTR